MKKFIAAASALAMLIMCASCAGNDAASSSTAGLISQAPANPIVTEEPFMGKYFETDIWEPVPMVSQAMIDAGYGDCYEGMQACMYVTLDPVEGKLGYYCTDVGGVYRTTDGGISIEPCNIGLKSAGASCAVIDPNNTDRAVLVGGDGGYNSLSGLHLTENGGGWWQPTFMPGDDGFIGQISSHYTINGITKGYDYRIQVAYDESSMDETIGGSAVVYWSREDYTLYDKSPQYNHPAIYKSTDGGKTWAELPDTAEYAGGYIVVHPKDGRVAVSNQSGVYVSDDGGKTFAKMTDMPANSMVGVRTKPDNLYLLNNDGLYISTDFGKNFKKVTEQMIPSIDYADHLRVSPSNPDKMVMLVKGKGDWDFRTYYTDNGGKSWSTSDRDSKSGKWGIPGSWKSVCWFSPIDENFIFANESVSHDGGKTFTRSTKGFNAICVGGKFSVNINNDKYWSLGSQDANGGFSTDYGKTWDYVPWSEFSWGGYCYGAYQINDMIGVTTSSKSWWTEGELVYTKDGGKTIVRTGLPVNGNRIGYAALGKENICFLAEWRTDDYCDTWTKMENCTGVFTHDPLTGRLFGANNFEIVYSDDDGATWTKLTIATGKIEDIAYNHVTGMLYVATSNRIYQINTKDEKSTLLMEAGFNLRYTTGICVDPENPAIMYVATGSNARDTNGVWRTLDGGKTWTQLMRQVNDGRDSCPDGGWGSCIDFCASTREIISSVSCHGVWKMKAAPADAK